MSAVPTCRLIGHWRIVKADIWERDYLDLCGPAQIIIENDGHGEIDFETMQAGLDLEYSQSMVFFTWQGFDEMDEVHGSGNAELLDNGTLEIEFAYHNGDEATLNAKPMTFSTAYQCCGANLLSLAQTIRRNGHRSAKRAETRPEGKRAITQGSNVSSVQEIPVVSDRMSDPSLCVRSHSSKAWAGLRRICEHGHSIQHHDNSHTIFRANPADNLTDPVPDITPKNLETIFGRPHNVIAVIENAVLAFVVLHKHIKFVLKHSRLNICVSSQANSGSHITFFLMRILASTMSLRIIAVNATLKGLPLLMSV